MKNSYTNFLKVVDEIHEINFHWPNKANKILLLFVHGQRHISIGKRRIKTYNKESDQVS